MEEEIEWESSKHWTTGNSCGLWALEKSWAPDGNRWLLGTCWCQLANIPLFTVWASTFKVWLENVWEVSSCINKANAYFSTKSSIYWMGERQSWWEAPINVCGLLWRLSNNSTMLLQKDLIWLKRYTVLNKKNFKKFWANHTMKLIWDGKKTV